MVTYSNEYNARLVKRTIASLVEYFGENNFLKHSHVEEGRYARFVANNEDFSPDECAIIMKNYNIDDYASFYMKADELAAVILDENAVYKKNKNEEIVLEKIGDRMRELQIDKKLNDYQAAALFDTGARIYNNIKRGQIYNKIVCEEISSSQVQSIIKSAVLYFDDQQLTKLYKQKYGSELTNVTDNGVGNIINSLRETPLIGSAKDIDEKPVKDLLLKNFIERLGTVSSQKGEGKTP